jgi:hypothetical protein
MNGGHKMDESQIVGKRDKTPLGVLMVLEAGVSIKVPEVLARRL